MGVKGLLKFVGPACHPSVVQRFSGMRFGLDMMCFICKALFHPDYMAHLELYMRTLLRSAGRVFMVFDGRAPHAKHEELRRRRASNRPKITPEIIRRIVEFYKGHPRVSIVFAPGEADSQLGYMSLKGFIDVVVTEDSDLIVYGCPLILYKLKPRGQCVVYQRSALRIPWDFATFFRVCLLCGCDYMRPGLRGFGFQRALRSVTGKTDLLDELANSFPVDEEFRRLFENALNAFTQQPVVCLLTKTVVAYNQLV